MRRREFLEAMGGGFGLLGLTQAGIANQPPPEMLASKRPHFEARAKHVIHLFLLGGPSQVDTFDPKPQLNRFHGKSPPSDAPRSGRKTGKLLGSPFSFKPYGESGLEVSEIFSRVGQCVDDICIIRSMVTEFTVHPPAVYMMNSGTATDDRPAMGSWITYGLGTENQNLPGYIVLCPGTPTMYGGRLWSSSFLPGAFHGTHIPRFGPGVPSDEIIPFLRGKNSATPRQRKDLDFLAQLNAGHRERSGADAQLDASIHAMEAAYRMQLEASDAFDISSEPEKLRSQYGEANFGRGCLIARRLVERGVRCVQVFFDRNELWDSHTDILQHRTLAADADPAIATLITDLKARGLLDETLIVVAGEFGRTPSVEVGFQQPDVQNGRDHNPHGYSVLLAGGGVKGGFSYGATDDLGYAAVENPVHPHDLLATILYLMGLDHERLTYRFSGRNFRLTDVGGHVIHDIIA